MEEVPDCHISVFCLQASEDQRGLRAWCYIVAFRAKHGAQGSGAVAANTGPCGVGELTEVLGGQARCRSAKLFYPSSS